jgi:HEAT repeat protein
VIPAQLTSRRRDKVEGVVMKLCSAGLLVVFVAVACAGPGAARGLEPLVQDLRTGDEPTRVRAVLALGHSSDPHAVEVLRQAAHDDSQLVRTHALLALKHLLLSLEHTSWLVTYWLHALLAQVEEQLEEPQGTTVKPSTEPPRAALSSEPPPLAGRKGFQ